MPVNAPLASDQWVRYQFIRDNGHLDYVYKASRCEDFFAGLQWEQSDLSLLKQSKRPALTINKIISTLSNVMGTQIFNRTEISFKPRNEGATSEVADALTKVFMQVSDNNQLDWVRSDVFTDGIIGSRGYYDVRMDFSDNLKGEVRITQLNPKNVLIDPDADEYDPETWNDVIVTKWMSPDVVALMYNKQDADDLRGREQSFFPYGYDSLDRDRDRFGTPRSVTYGLGPNDSLGLVRNIRVLERQYRVLDKLEHFVDLKNGDTRVVPHDWDRNRIAQELESGELGIIKKLVPRIRWTVTADVFVLHDDWSPYDHFTVVPYFPYFRRGRTIGLVENLLGPQELLNKVSSQELHVVNTTANSGWKVKTGSLQNMSTAELEQRGATTGLVLELNEINNAEKIQPNQTPQGLDRISYKAEEHIKTISGVSDYSQGFAREDVAAKSVVANQAAGSANLAKVMDNLQRTDHILARTILSLVQTYYTEERLLHITTDRLTGATQPLSVNQVTPEGRIVNDLTLGEYEVIVSSQPERDTFEDSQFDQALSMFEKGIPIPPEVLVGASRLKDKVNIVKQMTGDKESQAAQEQAQLQQRQQLAEVSKTEAEAQAKQADAALKGAKAQAEGQGDPAKMQEMQMKGDIAMQQMQLKVQEMDKKLEFMEKEMQLKQQASLQELEIKRESAQQDAAIKQETARTDIELKRSQAIQDFNFD